MFKLEELTKEFVKNWFSINSGIKVETKRGIQYTVIKSEGTGKLYFYRGEYYINPVKPTKELVKIFI